MYSSPFASAPGGLVTDIRAIQGVSPHYFLAVQGNLPCANNIEGRWWLFQADGLTPRELRDVGPRLSQVTQFS